MELMQIVAIIAGGVGAFALGVPWYMLLAKPWMKAAGVTQEQASQGDPLPYIFTIIAWLVSSFFLQNYLMAGAETLLSSVRVAFAAWIAMAMLSTVLSTMYGMRGKNLLWIDGGYTLGGALIIALAHHFIG